MLATLSAPSAGQLIDGIGGHTPPAAEPAPSSAPAVAPSAPGYDDLIDGNYVVQWRDFPDRGQTTEARLTIAKEWKLDCNPDAANWCRYRMVRDETTPLRLSGYHIDGNGRPQLYFNASSLALAPSGEVRIKHAYGVLGHWGGQETLRRTGPDELRGEWRYGDKDKGVSLWHRVRPRVERIVFKSSVENTVVPGAVGRVEVPYSGPGNNMRGNRPTFHIEIYGEHLWGMQRVSIADQRGIEPIRQRGIYEAQLKNNYGTIGLDLHTVIWHTATPGRKVLYVEDTTVPFDLILKDYPGPSPADPELALIAFGGGATTAKKGAPSSAAAALDRIRPFRAELRYPERPAIAPRAVAVKWQGGSASLPLKPGDRPNLFVSDWHYVGGAAPASATPSSSGTTIPEANTDRSARTVAELFHGRWQVSQTGGPAGDLRGFAQVGEDGRTIQLFLNGKEGGREYRAREVLGLRGAGDTPNLLEALFDDPAALAALPPVEERRSWPQGPVVAVADASSKLTFEAAGASIEANLAAAPASGAIRVLLRARGEGRLAGAWNSEPRGNGEGQQSWSRAASVDGAIALDDQLGIKPDGTVDLSTGYPFGRNGTQLDGRKATRTLFVYGRNLPTTSGDAIALQAEGDGIAYALEALPGESRRREFEDGWRKAGVTNREGLSALLVRATLPAGILPGPKQFTLNGLPAPWRLDFADAYGRLRFAHRWRAGEFTPTESLFTADTAFIVIDDAGAAPRDSLTIRLTRNGELVGDKPLVLRRVGTPDNAEFQSPPLRLIRRSMKEYSPPPESGAIDIEVRSGDRLEAELAEPTLFRTLPPKAAVRVVDTPAALGDTWRFALRRMAACYNETNIDFDRISFAEAEIYSKFILTEKLPFVRSRNNDIRITKGDHAAAILIRNEIVAMMRETVPLYEKLARGDDAAIRSLMAQGRGRSDGMWTAARARNPLGHDISLGELADMRVRPAEWGMTRAQAQAYAIPEMRRALAGFVGQINAAVQRANAAGDCNLAELLVIAGQPAPGPVQRILPRLVRLAEEGGHKHWVADNVAQGFVRGLHTAGEAVRALEAYAKVDDAYKAMALALVSGGAAALASGLGYVGAAGYIAIGGDLADMAYFGGQGVADYVEGSRLVDYARGASPALGNDFLAEAEMASSQWYHAAIGLIAPGVGAGLGARGLRQLRNAEAVARGARLADGLGTLDAQSLGRLSAAERTELAALYTDLQARRLRDGQRALSDGDKARLAKFDGYFNRPVTPPTPPVVAANATPGPAAATPAVRLPPPGRPPEGTVRLPPPDLPPEGTVRLPPPDLPPEGTVRLPSPDLPPAATAGRRTGPEATAPTVRLGPEATAPTVRIGPEATAPTVRIGPEATAPTVRMPPPNGPPPGTTRLPPPDLPPEGTVRLPPPDLPPAATAGRRTGPEATAPTVRIGPEATAPTVRIGPEATAPTVRTGPEATAPTVRMPPPNGPPPGTTRLPPPDLPPEGTVRLPPPDLPPEGTARLPTPDLPPAASSRTASAAPSPVAPAPRPAGSAGRVASAPAGGASGAVEELLEIPEHILPGRIVRVRGANGDETSIVFDKFHRAGSNNDVYLLPTPPNARPLLARISKQASNHPKVRFDQFGRDTLERLTARGGPLDGKLEVVGARTYSDVTASFAGLNKRTIAIVEQAPTIAARQLEANPGGAMTAGQAIAYDRGVRALNKSGYAILDGHVHNFYFRQLSPPADDWRMVIIDPGGIVPARGASAAERALNARALQRYVDNPPAGLVTSMAGSAIKPGGALYGAAKEAAIRSGPLERLLDRAAPGLPELTEDIPFLPHGAEPFANARSLFDVPEAQVEAAYDALRAGP